MEYQWQVISVTPSNRYAAAIPYIIFLFMGLLFAYGIVSLIKRRFQAFAEFLYFVVNALFLMSCMVINMHLYQKEELSVLDKIALWVVVFFVLYYAIHRLRLLKNVLSGNSFQMNSAMLRLGGTPSIIFFTYLLRSFILPLLACSIVSIFNLSVSPAWNAVFSIYGFIWVWDVIRMMFQCNSLRFNKQPYSKKERRKKWINSFCLTQHSMLFLPEFGLFLMWYFDWFPMKKWLIWLFCIYGLIWLMSTGISLIIKEK